MEPAQLIENLVTAIEDIAQAADDCGSISVPGAVANALDDAKDTAALAKLIASGMALQAQAPTGALTSYFDVYVDETGDELVFTDKTSAEAFTKAVQAAGGNANLNPATSVDASQALANLQSYLGQIQPHPPVTTCSACSGPLDSNGDCLDPGCSSHPGPPLGGSKPFATVKPGSLYQGGPARPA